MDDNDNDIVDDNDVDDNDVDDNDDVDETDLPLLSSRLHPQRARCCHAGAGC